MRIIKACLICIVLLLLVSGCAAKESKTDQNGPIESPTFVPTVIPEKKHIPTPRPTPEAIFMTVSTPTPTPSPVPTPSPTPEPFLGEWTYRFDGTDIILFLYGGGAGYIRYSEKEQPLTWKYSEGKLALTGINTVFSAVFSQEGIALETPDGKLVFKGKDMQ